MHLLLMNKNSNETDELRKKMKALPEIDFPKNLHQKIMKKVVSLRRGTPLTARSQFSKKAKTKLK